MYYYIFGKGKRSMRRAVSIIIITLSIGLGNNSFSQDKFQSAKSEILKTIFEQLKPKECTFIALLADMEYREVHFTLSGGMPSSVVYDELMNDDTISISKFAEGIKTDTCFRAYIKTFKQEGLSRNDFIVSKKFMSNISAWKQHKLYIEVQKPISGWEIFKLFKFEKDFKTGETMKYSLPFVLVPVFTYSVDDNKETMSQLIFKFKMEYENNKAAVRFVSKTEL